MFINVKKFENDINIMPIFFYRQKDAWHTP